LLFLLLTWFCFSCIAWLMGITILNRFDLENDLPLGDRTIISLWLGILSLAWVLFIVSFFVPLTPIVGLLTTLIGITPALISKQCRDQARLLWKAIARQSPWLLLTLLGCTLALSWLCSQTVYWSDTGLYHYQAISWFSQYGTVPGLALIHNRFATNSPWFALIAPLNAGIFTTRISSSLGGFAYLLGFGQACLHIKRIIHQRDELTDWFASFAFLLLLPSSIKLTVAMSVSPDQPILIMSVIIPWLILKAKSKVVHNSSKIALLAVIFSAFIVVLKLTALPFLFVTIFLYLSTVKNKVLSFLRISTLSFIGLLPLFIFNVVVSGCPLYPSSVACFDLPWSVGKQEAAQYLEFIQKWNQWYFPEAIPENPLWGEWILPWLGIETPFVFLIICSIAVMVIALVQPQQMNVKGKNYFLFLTVFGIIYIVFSVPTWRFGAGYSCILPALYLACRCREQVRMKWLAVLICSGGASLWWEFSLSLELIMLITIVFSGLTLLIFKENKPRFSLFLQFYGEFV